MTALSDLDAIREIVQNTDERRTRARRESWAAIKAVLNDEESDGEEVPTPPPLAGPGSGVKAWVTYAEAIGVEVPEGADRGTVVEAIEAAQSPEENEDHDADSDEESDGEEVPTDED